VLFVGFGVVYCFGVVCYWCGVCCSGFEVGCGFDG